MISLTIIPEPIAHYKQKPLRIGEQTTQNPRIRFNSLQEISNIKLASSRIVPIQFTTQPSTNRQFFYETIVNPWDAKYKDEPRSKLLDQHRRKQIFSSQNTNIHVLKEKQKMPLFENLDDQLNQFRAVRQPFEADYIRVYYEKLALESYIQQMRSSKKPIFTTFEQKSKRYE